MADPTARDQATVVEVPVTIQGAKHVDGTEQRQIFTETTKTTIVFGNGAVVNLNSKVALGQCVFLRNDRTGKEILCKVLEWRQVADSGYADLEFTTRDTHFWDAPAQEPAAAAPIPEPQKPIVAAPQLQADAPKMVANLSARLELVAAHEAVAVPEEPTTSEEAASDEAESSEPEAQAAAPAPDDGADWDEAKDAALLKALMATDPKRKPRRESSDAETKSADGETISEGAAEQGKTGAGSEREGEGESLPIAARASSWIRGLHKFTYGKNAIAVGIAASVLLVAIVGFAWHAKHSATAHSSNRAPATAAQPKQAAQAVAQAVAQPGTAQPVPAPAAVGAANAPATVNAGNNGAETEAPAHGNNSGATPAQAAQKIQQQTAATAPAAAVAKNDGPSVVPSGSASSAPKLEARETMRAAEPGDLSQPKHRNSKSPNGGETIPARIVAQPAPAIPPWAKGLDTDGIVKVDALIDEKGNLRSTRAVSGPLFLQHEAERAVALWIFEPALTDGKPTATHMVLTVQFQR